jgi:hypothetical protein
MRIKIAYAALLPVLVCVFTWQTLRSTGIDPCFGIKLDELSLAGALVYSAPFAVMIWLVFGAVIVVFRKIFRL